MDPEIEESLEELEDKIKDINKRIDYLIKMLKDKPMFTDLERQSIRFI